MIPNIVDGGNTQGLMRYLLGPGRANEHTDPHVVAGSARIMHRWANRTLDTDAAAVLAGKVDRHMKHTGTRPEGDVRGYDPESGQTRVIRVGPNHVWHCSLSLSPDEGPLTDEQWQEVATIFMDEMGFTGSDGRAPCRWLAVRHGESKNGGEHIHIVANKVREDGTKWNPWYDQKRSQTAANRVERRCGLRVLESREHKRGSRCDSAQALNEARARGEKLTDRQQLELRIRTAAKAANTEQDFVTRLRTLGVRARPRFAKGRDDVVTGYSVALHTRPGEQTKWWGANRVSRDLALSRLRERWADTPTSASDAVEAWRDAWKGLPARTYYRSYTATEYNDHCNWMRMMRQTFAQVDPTNAVALADATQDVAGILSAAALNHDGTRLGDDLSVAARQVGRHAQLHRRPQQRNVMRFEGMLVARLLSTAIMTPNSAAWDWAVLMETMELVRSLISLYVEVKQFNTARMIERDTRAVFDTLQTAGEAMEPLPFEVSERMVTLASDVPLQTDLATPADTDPVAPDDVPAAAPERVTANAGASQRERVAQHERELARSTGSPMAARAAANIAKNSPVDPGETLRRAGGTQSDGRGRQTPKRTETQKKGKRR